MKVKKLFKKFEKTLPEEYFSIIKKIDEKLLNSLKTFEGGLIIDTLNIPVEYFDIVVIHYRYKGFKVVCDREWLKIEIYF